jgi:hypothetical protein
VAKPVFLEEMPGIRRGFSSCRGWDERSSKWIFVAHYLLDCLDWRALMNRNDMNVLDGY